MRRGAGAAAHAILIAALAGCGGAEGISIEFSSRALLDRAANVFVYFYSAETPCQLVRQTVPRPPSLLGPFTAPVTPEGKTRGISFTLNTIPVGTYVVFVDALDENGGNVGTGCAPGQEVLEKELSQIRVVVSEE
jgi:hypothetical protein